MVSVRAIYRDGKFQPLEAVGLPEGQEVQLEILQPPSQLLDAIADMLVNTSLVEAFDEDEVQRQLDAALKGKRPLSEIIIEARWSS